MNTEYASILCFARTVYYLNTFTDTSMSVRYRYSLLSAQRVEPRQANKSSSCVFLNLFDNQSIHSCMHLLLVLIRNTATYTQTKLLDMIAAIDEDLLAS